MLNDNREKNHISYQARYHKAFASEKCVCYEKAISLINLKCVLTISLTVNPPKSPGCKKIDKKDSFYKTG